MSSDSQVQRPWLDHYPAGVPAQIDLEVEIVDTAAAA